jgi:signal recognition particle subunit SRP54
VAAIRERAVGIEVLESITPAQQVVKIVNDQLVEVLGTDAVPLVTGPQPPTIVMLVGLQGSGKTTTAAKLALGAKGRGGNPLLVAADTQRPAAIDQLVTLGKQIDLPVYSESTDVPPLDIVVNGIERGRANNHSHVILDTAGRLQVDDALMDEIGRISARTSPHETLLVADATTGQEAVTVAEAFHARSPLTGLVLTKLDGDARGGAALSVRAVTGIPIKFVGTGEAIEPLETFHPDRMASRILGMGDVLSLVERAEQVVDKQQAEKMQRKMRDASFGLDDFLEQLEQVKKMGSLSQIFGMLPGMGGAANDPNVRQALEGDGMRRFEAIILSMSPQERSSPDIITGSRRRRIAAGSGTTVQDVNQLLKQFKQARQVMQMMSQGKMPAGLKGMFGN